MHPWIKLEPRSFQKPVRTEEGGVEIVVGMSPYDLPEAVRGFFDAASDRFVIEFKYLGGSESAVPGIQQDDICLLVGEHSDRLYKILVNVKKLRAQAVNLRIALPQEVEKAIRGLAQKPHRLNRAGHYQVANEVIAQKGNELLAGV